MTTKFRDVDLLKLSIIILSRLDYCNNVLVGLPANLIRRLQSVQNAAARLIYGIRRSEHITDALVMTFVFTDYENITLIVIRQSQHSYITL